jgi:glycosyltransferase involved in cell wall biosynthesis
VTAPVSNSSSLTSHRWRIVHSEASLGWGGQERRIMAELEGFRRRGSEVWLLAPSESEIFRRGRQAGIACEPLAVERWKFPFAALKTAAWLRRIRPHVVNPHSSRDGWLVGVAARLARVPFILRTRHFDVPISSRHVSGFVYSRLADHVITTSPKVTAHFRELFRLPESRVSTLSTGVDVELFSPRGDVAQIIPAAQQKKLPLIGMISIIRLAKGHEILLQAAQKLRAEGLQAHYVIVGEGPYLDAVRQKVRALQLTDCVTFTGHREDIPAVLRALAVLAMPSLHEGIPQVVLQALATKTPVVASNVGGIPSIIRAGETGRLVPPGDADALARSIRETLLDTVTTRNLAECGRELVEQEHNLEGMLDQLEALYQRCLPATD